jgi:putative peptidoglycan lipid II flippase
MKNPRVQATYFRDLADNSKVKSFNRLTFAIMNERFSQILHAAFRFLSGTSLSRLSGLARDVTMAACFGATASVAAFLVAFRLAHLLRRVLGEGALQTAFIPLFEKYFQHNPKRAFKFFVDLKISLSLALFAIVLLGMGGIYLWGNGEIAHLSMLLLPSLPFICLFGLNAALLQCQNHYFIPGAAPVAFNLLWIAGALFLRGVPDEQAMSSLAYFVVLGCAAQWGMTLPQVAHAWQKKGDTELFSPDVRAMLRPLSLAIIGVAAAQINSALDAVFARFASLEAPAYLWYAIRIQQLPIALIGVALAGAILPSLSRAIHAGAVDRYQKLLKKSLLTVTLLMSVITIGIFLFADPLIRLIYGHGDFSVAAVEETALCLVGYAIGLIPMAWVLVLAPGCNARGQYKEPAIASTCSMIANIGFNALFIFGFGWGAFSIALATSLSAFINAGILCVRWRFVNSQRYNDVTI